MKLKVYTCGYIAGAGSDRFNWREDLASLIKNTTASSVIQFLHPGVPPNQIPGQGDPRLYSARDVAQIAACDVLFAYFDLSVNRGLGASVEMGLAYGLQKRIIMVDKSPEIGSLGLNRALADVVWDTLPNGADHLAFIGEGFKENQETSR